MRDAAQKGGAMMSGLMAKVHPNTTGKLAIQAYAFERLEIASDRMLRVVAAQKIGGLLDGVSEHDLVDMGLVAA